MQVVQLTAEHAGLLDAFLAREPEVATFLRSNLQRDPLGQDGAARDATYVGAFEDGALVAVVAHYWTGVLIPHGRLTAIDALARLVVGLSGRPVTGVVGPTDEVAVLRQALGLSDVYARMDSEELLYGTSLERMPAPAQPELTLRPIAEVDDEPVLSWYRAFEVEALGAEPGPELERAVRARLRRNRQDASAWVAYAGDTPVCVVGFNARLPDIVQVGGAYTPPEHRGNGYAGEAMLALLARARSEGVERATLFIRRDNERALRTYEALGFERLARFRLVLFI